MSVAPLNLGWLLVMLMLGQGLGQAQVRRLTNPRLSDRPNTLTLVWNPSPSPGVIGYAVYWGLSDDACTNRIALNNVTNATLVGFKVRDTYHLAVAAYDADGEESPRSNPLQYSRRPQVIPAMGGTNLLQLQRLNLTVTNSVLRLSFTGQAEVNYQLQATEDFQRWDVLCITNCSEQQLVVYDVPYSATIPHRFFRLLPD